MLELWALLYSIEPPAAPDLYDYGFAGIIIALLSTGVFRYKGEVFDLRNDLKEQRDLNRQQNEIIKQLQTQLTFHTIPAMERNVQVLEAIPDRETQIMQDLKNTQKEMKDLMARLEKFSGNGG